MKSTKHSVNDSFKKGATVEVSFTGKIEKEHKDGTYDIKCTDGNHITISVHASHMTLIESHETIVDDVFNLDDKVECNFKGKGKWYPGTVSRVRADDSTFDVVYDDGDKELHVPGARLRYKDGEAPLKFKVSPSTFSVGNSVEARYKGRSRYYSAKIAKVHTKNDVFTYDLDYDDGEKELNVDEALIRFLPSQSGSSSPDEAEAEGIDWKYAVGTRGMISFEC